MQTNCKFVQFVTLFLRLRSDNLLTHVKLAKVLKCSVLTNSEIQQLMDVTMTDAMTESHPPYNLLVSGLVSTDTPWPLMQTLLFQIMSDLGSNDVELRSLGVRRRDDESEALVSSLALLARDRSAFAN